jgi:hypothetical protein
VSGPSKYTKVLYAPPTVRPIIFKREEIGFKEESGEKIDTSDLFTTKISLAIWENAINPLHGFFVQVFTFY